MINLGVLKNLSNAKKYKKGSIITTGVHCTEMYIVLKGLVGLYKIDCQKGNIKIADVVPGESFHEAVLISENLPTAAVALTDVIVLPIQNKNVAFLENEPELAVELMKEMCGRFERLAADYEELVGKPWTDETNTAHHVTAAQILMDVQKAPEPVEKPHKGRTQSASPIPLETVPSTDKHIISEPIALFPEGHGCYELTLHNDDKEHLLEKSYTCPICSKRFKALQVKSSKLALDRADSDFRSRYKDVEPLYYDVVTCPHCFYSALKDMFHHPDKLRPELPKDYESLKMSVPMQFGSSRDTFSVFAGYYMALLCAPGCFMKHQLATATLLLKLSRVYQDSGDTNMEMHTAKKALDAYLDVYYHAPTDPRQDQQLWLIIAELSFKMNDIKRAKSFFFKARTNRSGAPVIKNHAENRLMHIREMESQQCDQENDSIP